VTICTQNRELFLKNEDVRRMVTNVWRQLESKYPQIRLDEFVVMPNHIHGVILIDVVGADQCVCPDNVGGIGKGKQAGSPQPGSSHQGSSQPHPPIAGSTKRVVGADQRVCPDNVGGMGKGEHAGSPQQRSPGQVSSKKVTLGAIIQWFKTMTTNYYLRGIRNNAWTPLASRFWQRNYYERIIRNENEMNRIRQYITGNPARWAWDHNNPNRIAKKTSRETTS